MKLWHRFLPATLFGRLLALLVVAVVASHVLALTLMFELRPAPPLREPGLLPPPPSLQWRVDRPFGGPPPPVFSPARPPESMFPQAPRWTLLLDIGIRIAALSVAAWIGARWLSRPMKRLAQAARTLGDDVHGAPLPEAGPSECRETTRVFNQMQTRIRQQLEERDQFVAAVSHDLRTPLTRLALRIEQVDRDARDKLRGDVREMEAMIASTLDYLRGQAQAEAFVAVDVAALAQAVVDDEAERGAPVSFETPHVRAALAAQPIALRRAVANLVQNAVRYGGSAQVSVAIEGDRLRIAVADRGPGIAAAELDRVCLPFYRVDGSRNRQNGGVGLGLAIVRTIARRHGGDVSLAAREGGGLVAALVLPFTL